MNLIMAEMGALPAPGGDRKSEEVKDQGDIVTLIRGNNPTYALKRLKRDRPDLAAKVVAGDS